MTAAYKYRIPPYIKYFTSDDWLQFSLDQLKGRNKQFRYTPLIGLDILTGILQRRPDNLCLRLHRRSCLPRCISLWKGI